MNPEINKIIIETLLPFDPIQISVFGSYARGEMTDESDIDIAYRFPRGLTLFDIVGMKLDLEERLDCKVDFVGRDNLNKFIEPYILQDLKVIYEKE